MEHLATQIWRDLRWQFVRSALLLEQFLTQVLYTIVLGDCLKEHLRPGELCLSGEWFSEFAKVKTSAVSSSEEENKKSSALLLLSLLNYSYIQRLHDVSYHNYNRSLRISSYCCLHPLLLCMWGGVKLLLSCNIHEHKTRWNQYWIKNTESTISVFAGN